MPKHSFETRDKISAGVRAANARKKLAADPTQQRGAELAAHFATGHPDGQAPGVVRNYGDLGRVQGEAPERRRDAGLQTHEEKVAAAATTAEQLGLRRAPDVKQKKVGEQPAQVRPPEFGAGLIENVPSAPQHPVATTAKDGGS